MKPTVVELLHNLAAVQFGDRTSLIVTNGSEQIVLIRAATTEELAKLGEQIKKLGEQHGTDQS